jgi:hypothetical protein
MVVPLATGVSGNDDYQRACGRRETPLQGTVSFGSLPKGLLINPDKSVDVYFGPKAPTGKENNWVQTIPGKGWNVLLRLYGPLEPWFDKTWRPGEFELVP